MIRTRLTAPLVLSVILVCSIYWLSRATTPAFATIHQSLRDTILGDHWEHIPSNEQAAGYAQYHTSQSITTPYGVILSSDDAEGYEHPDTSKPFPRHIWQSSSIAGKEKYSKQIQTWKDNTDYDYHWLSDADADTFVYNAFNQSQPSLVAFWNDLSNKIHAEATTTATESTPDRTANTPSNQIVVNSTSSSSIILRADLLRYMLMSIHGGVYTDIDTSVLMPISHWLPDSLTSQPQPHPINAVIGIEYDDTKLAMFVRPISFCQWTLMSKPNHPIFTRAIQRVISNLEFLARRQRVQSLSDLKLDKLDVLEATGPGMISDVVLEVISDQLPNDNITWQTFHGQKEPRLFGDILILPINGFAGAQKHSHAGDPEYGQMLVRHHFGRSWYKPAAAKLAKGA